MSNLPNSPFEPLDSTMLEAWQLISFRRILNIGDAVRVQHLLDMAGHLLLSRHDPSSVSEAVAGRAKLIFALAERLHFLFPAVPPSPILHSIELVCLTHAANGIGQFRLEMMESSLQVFRWLGGNETLSSRRTPSHLPAFYWVADFHFLNLGSLWSGLLLQDLAHSICVELQHDLDSSLANRVHPADLKFVRTGLIKFRDDLRERQFLLSSIVDEVLNSISARLTSISATPVSAVNNPHAGPMGEASKEPSIVRMPATWPELLQGAYVASQTTSSSNQTTFSTRRTNRALNRARARLEGRQSFGSNVV
ncbi:hypothetical protein CVT24_010995 [Panaeolus cyanescens]|uniref:Uncharacterized protein n=1 Tax=Panaeolus cyanescens TaxID=181874 RepID=A0A409WDY2_9AGAR|nr:hypothetical protein CVT24_010995 [Panaeolus cyanescens]